MTATQTANDQDPHAAGVPIETMQLGVYRLVTEKPTFRISEQWNKAARGLPTMLRLVQDIYALNPWMFFLFLFMQLWNLGIQPVLSLHLSSQVLVIIEDGLKKDNPDGSAIFQAVGLNMVCLVLTALLRSRGNKVEYKLMNALDFKLQTRLLRSKLATDLTGAQVKGNQRVSVSTAWYTFRNLTSIVTSIISAIGQLAYVVRTMQSSGAGSAGLLFVILCVSEPLIDVASYRSLWSEPHIYEATDPHYLRMKGLLALADKKYKQDVITGDIVQHIIQEFRKAVKLLGDIDLSSPYDQYWRLRGMPMRLAMKLAKDLPMLYYAGNAILNPTKFKVATVAILLQTETMLGGTFQDIFWSLRNFSKRVSMVKAVYDLENVIHETKGGDLPYPRPDRPQEQGMPIELKNVSFSYPGAANKALDDVTVSIKPGQLVVVVGTNGSGKSTIVKLLTRLYDPTSGEIMVDGEDIQKYRIADLRRATAALTQDHHLFPLSLRENIGLGNPACVGDLEMIRKAAAQGGAEGLVARLGDGLETVLERPRGLQWGSDVQKGEGSLLARELEKMEKEGDVSGGERQRLVASRTFMRFTSGAVKLVCVDEPSANLDPDGEWKLFDNLRLAREGKTMIFVTHRFAHLTKHADMILCMKDGRIFESGTHEELMKLGGEYCKMYNIQAEAFEQAQAFE